MTHQPPQPPPSEPQPPRGPGSQPGGRQQPGPPPGQQYPPPSSQPWPPQQPTYRPPPPAQRRKRRGWMIALTVFGGILVIGAIGNAVSKPTPAAKTSSASHAAAATASHSSSPPVTACSGQHWPHRVPRVIGRTLGSAGHGVLLCFNVVAAYALGDHHDVTNDPANTAREWVIGRIHPAPGTLVHAKTPITLYVRRSPQFVPAPSSPPVASPAPPPSPASPPSPAPASSAPPGCYPLSNGGNCYEPGEYCRASDQGVTGVAGDGESIICEENNGLRWEPTG